MYAGEGSYQRLMPSTEEINTVHTRLQRLEHFFHWSGPPQRFAGMILFPVYCTLRVWWQGIGSSTTYFGRNFILFLSIHLRESHYRVSAERRNLQRLTEHYAEAYGIVWFGVKDSFVFSDWSSVCHISCRLCRNSNWITGDWYYDCILVLFALFSVFTALMKAHLVRPLCSLFTYLR